MRKTILAGVAMAALAIAVGCSSKGEPTQPKLSDDQIKAVMKQGREHSVKEHGNRFPGKK